MLDWKLTKRNLKSYPHFDGPIPLTQAELYVKDPKTVSSHAFFPFIMYKKRWTKFTQRGQKGDVKEREIRYAARKDSYIYSYYRYLLSAPYEKELENRRLDSCVIAYRKIRGARRGKCNIDFAVDAFLNIRRRASCYVLTFDICSFFESLDHAIIKKRWIELLNCKRLPADHYNVFRHITKYSIVERDELYKRLKIDSNLSKTKHIPIKLCSNQIFRRLVAGDGASSIIKRNPNNFGIPQGSAISDIIANFYLTDFDCWMNNLSLKYNGSYYRYSDDILLILESDDIDKINKLSADIKKEITRHGANLRMKDSKSSIHFYQKEGKDQKFVSIYGKQGKNGLEYLGFRYDGRQIFIRDSTLSNLMRKISNRCKKEALSLKKRYRGKTGTDILKIYNFETLWQRFGSVRDFESAKVNSKNWTFLTYKKRADFSIPKELRGTARQLRNLRRNIKTKLKYYLDTI